MRIQTLDKKEKKEFEQKLNENYGISLPRCQLVKAGNEKIRLFTGDFSEHELNILAGNLRVETIGTYFARIDDEKIRLSFDASNLFKATKNIIEIDEEEAKTWLKGRDIENKTKKAGYFLIKFNNNILGCGKATQSKILNFVPKERRAK